MESSQARSETHDMDTIMHGVETLLKEMRDSRHDNRVHALHKEDKSNA